jgi:hypothetical protein
VLTVLDFEAGDGIDDLGKVGVFDDDEMKPGSAGDSKVTGPTSVMPW